MKMMQLLLTTTNDVEKDTSSSDNEGGNETETEWNETEWYGMVICHTIMFVIQR